MPYVCAAGCIARITCSLECRLSCGESLNAKVSCGTHLSQAERSVRACVYYVLRSKVKPTWCCMAAMLSFFKFHNRQYALHSNTLQQAFSRAAPALPSIIKPPPWHGRCRLSGRTHGCVRLLRTPPLRLWQGDFAHAVVPSTNMRTQKCNTRARWSFCRRFSFVRRYKSSQQCSSTTKFYIFSETVIFSQLYT